MAVQNVVETIFTEAGSIVDLGLFSIQITRSDNLDHLDLAIAKEKKWTESACCAISGKEFGNPTVLTASILQKPIALSAVSMNTDQRVFQDGYSVVWNNNEGTTYGIHNCTVDSALLVRGQKLAVARKITLHRL